MKEMAIDGRKRLVFVLKEDVGATIVIPIDVLSPVDYKRLKEAEAQGGEMLKTLRDTQLDNGRNALALYKNLITVVYKQKQKAPSPLEGGETRPEGVTGSAIKASTQEAVNRANETKRGRGRPRKNPLL